MPCSKQAAIKEAFAHSWKGYVDYAWGMDELTPLTKAGMSPACPAAHDARLSLSTRTGQCRMPCVWA